LQHISDVKSFSQPFVPTATLVPGKPLPTVSFTTNANLTSDAHSTDRLQHFLGTGQ
jgi:hypothetical protein